jgi:hypothetical protein
MLIGQWLVRIAMRSPQAQASYSRQAHGGPRHEATHAGRHSSRGKGSKAAKGSVREVRRRVTACLSARVRRLRAALLCAPLPLSALWPRRLLARRPNVATGHTRTTLRTQRRFGRRRGRAAAAHSRESQCTTLAKFFRCGHRGNGPRTRTPLRLRVPGAADGASDDLRVRFDGIRDGVLLPQPNHRLTNVGSCFTCCAHGSRCSCSSAEASDGGPGWRASAPRQCLSRRCAQKARHHCSSSSLKLLMLS